MNTTNRHSGTRRPSAGRRTRRALPSLLAALLGGMLLTGCGSQQPITLGDLSSDYNKEVFWMSVWAIALSIIIFIGVSYALFYTVNKFREDKHDAPPAQFHGNNRLETWLVVVPVIIVMLLSVLTVRSMAILNPTPAEATKIDVLGRQFWWNFSYPETKADAGGNVTNGNEMVMPIGEQVALTITSGDVIHGFWAPNIGGQRAAMPATLRTWNVDTNRAGVYQGNCTQLCGASHANMRYKVIALEPERYTNFLAAAKAYRAPEPAAGSAEARGYAHLHAGQAGHRRAGLRRVPPRSGHPGSGRGRPRPQLLRHAPDAGRGHVGIHGTRKPLGSRRAPASRLHAWIKHSPLVKPGSLMPTYDGSEYRVNGNWSKAAS